MAPITYKDKRILRPTASRWPSGSPCAGYVIVFKNSVPEEAVNKYMSDIVDAGGRLTQTYDWFLHVCSTLVSQPLATINSLVPNLVLRGFVPPFLKHTYNFLTRILKSTILVSIFCAHVSWGTSFLISLASQNPKSNPQGFNVKVAPPSWKAHQRAALP